MSNWKNKRLARWKVSRQKGRFHYVAKTTLIVGVSILLGNIIGFILFDKIRSWGEFLVDFGIATAASLVFFLILGNVIWAASEAWYQKKCDKK